eukprot:2571600-Pyramimonas_sp.AAC.1
MNECSGEDSGRWTPPSMLRSCLIVAVWRLMRGADQAPGYEERHTLYQLFHLLNHLCMYGIEYYPFVKREIEKVLQ